MTASSADIVSLIYESFVSKDVARIHALFDDHLADDVVLHEPESLPYGGTYSGLDALKAFVAGLASDESPVDAARLVVEDLVASGDRVVGYVSFPWQPAGAPEPIPMRALELFTFRAGRVAEMRVFL